MRRTGNSLTTFRSWKENMVFSAIGKLLSKWGKATAKKAVIPSRKGRGCSLVSLEITWFGALLSEIAREGCWEQPHVPVWQWGCNLRSVREAWWSKAWNSFVESAWYVLCYWGAVPWVVHGIRWLASVRLVKAETEWAWQTLPYWEGTRPISWSTTLLFRYTQDT